MSDKYHVGKVDCSIPSQPFSTLEDAQNALELIEQLDPKGVSGGEYFLDGPEPESDIAYGITYRELWKQIIEMNDEQLDSDVTVCVVRDGNKDGEYFGIQRLEFNHTTDVLDENHPFLYYEE